MVMEDKRVLDAGAGERVLQWMLAERSAQVISADRRSRSHLSLRIRARYQTVGLRACDLSRRYDEYFAELVNCALLRDTWLISTSAPAITECRGAGGTRSTSRWESYE